MNLSEEELPVLNLPDDFEELVEEAPPSALYPGDTGELTQETRRALVQILSGPSIDQRRHSKLWNTLMKNEKIIRSRLAELFLELVIDRDQQVAFTRQAEAPEIDAPTLLRRSQMTFIDSALLLFLRQRLAHSDINDERAVVSREEILEHLAPFERSTNTDHAGFTKRINASIEKFKKLNLIQGIRASEGRFEVAPTLKLVFPAEQIQALTYLYKGLAGDITPEGDDGNETDDTSEEDS